MHRRIRYLGTFVPHQLSPEVKELYSSTILMNFGLAMVQMFEPIYLYSIGYSLPEIMLFFLAVYGMYFLLIPLGAKFAGRFGTERSIELSTIFISLLYVCLFAIQYNHQLFYLAAALYALQKMFYWPAFHADFAQHASSIERAREVSSLTVATSLVFILGPILAGYLISIGGYGWLFIIVALIFLLSNLPLMSTDEQFVPFSFPYWRTYVELFSTNLWRFKVAYLGYAEEYVVMVVWPIFIATVVKDDFQIGLVIGLMVLVSTVVTLIAGKFADKHRDHRPILRLGSLLYSMTWILRTVISTVGGVFTAGSLSWLLKNIISVALTSSSYASAKRRNVMKTVVEFELSLVVGKLAMIVILLGVFSLVPDLHQGFNWAFVAAAVTSLLYMML